MRVLYLITARGGSKGIERKNLQEIAGIPLVGFKAISARRSKYCSRLIISTDSAEIQESARSYGVDVPFTRPAELATDTATSVDVVLHAIDYIENETDEQYDAVMLLEPPTPFARHIDYDSAVELMMRRQANVVVGVREMEVNSVFVGPLDQQGRITSIIDKIQATGPTQRQAVDKEYTMNAALYLLRWDFFRKHKAITLDRENTYGYVMDRFHSADINEPVDLAWARFLAESRTVDISYWTQYT